VVCVALPDIDELALPLGIGVVEGGVVGVDVGRGVDGASGKVDGGASICAHDFNERERRAARKTGRTGKIIGTVVSEVQ